MLWSVFQYREDCQLAQCDLQELPQVQACGEEVIRNLLFRLQLWRIDRRLKSAKTLSDLRWCFNELGCSLDHLTDDELLERSQTFAKALHDSGVTMAEADDALKGLVVGSQKGVRT
jgi:hypothetical protein